MHNILQQSNEKQVKARKNHISGCMDFSDVARFFNCAYILVLIFLLVQ